VALPTGGGMEPDGGLVDHRTCPDFFSGFTGKKALVSMRRSERNFLSVRQLNYTATYHGREGRLDKDENDNVSLGVSVELPNRVDETWQVSENEITRHLTLSLTRDHLIRLLREGGLAPPQILNSRDNVTLALHLARWYLVAPGQTGGASPPGDSQTRRPMPRGPQPSPTPLTVTGQGVTITAGSRSSTGHFHIVSRGERDGIWFQVRCAEGCFYLEQHVDATSPVGWIPELLRLGALIQAESRP
jgi:hypothetical protein